MSTKKYGSLDVVTHPDRKALGLDAGQRVAKALAAAIAANGEARVIFGCAPSQNEFLETLVKSNVDWSKVVVFHMDEYVSLAGDHPQSFRTYLRDHLLSKIPAPKKVNLIKADGDADAEAKNYAKLLGEKPIDVCCLGIGENGHLAFNDPPVADFNDPLLVKRVELDLECRQQQVNDGCFPTLDKVPTHALTITIPGLLNSKVISGCVPGPRKAIAVRDSLTGPIHTACPGSILRNHKNAVLHIDTASASLLSH